MTVTQVGHTKIDDCDTYIGRGPDGVALGDVQPHERGWLGNPHYTADNGECPECGEEHTREEAIEAFREDFEDMLHDSRFRSYVVMLHGNVLGGWCRSLDEDEPACHGDVIAEWADKLAER